MNIRIISILAAAAIVMSCSIKEDRSECACLLVLALTECSDAPDNIRIDLRTLDERIEQNYIPGQDRPFYEYPVTKGSCSLSAFLCPRELSTGTEKIIVSLGENSPELYASRSVFEASGETAEFLVVLHKQFANVVLDLEESPWEGVDCEIIVSGAVNGISLATLDPIEGRFRYNVPVGRQGERAFRLPRQTESSAGMLTLELKSGDGSPQVFELGKYLSEAGYDWKEEDLRDVVVKIKESEMVIEIISSDWITDSTDVIVI